MRYRIKQKKKKPIEKEYIPNEEFLDTIEEQPVCPCWPNHCMNPKDHEKEFGVCWCSPSITDYTWGFTVQHNEEEN